MLYTKKFVFTVSLCAMLAVNPVWAVTNPVEAKAAAKSGTPGEVSTVYSDWAGRATSGIAGVSYVNNAVDAAGNAAQWAENHAAAAAQSAKSAAGSASDAAKVLEKAVLRPDEAVKEGKAVGSKTLPVYVNADGTVATITSYQGKAATAGTADKAKADINGAQIDTTYEKLSNKVTTLSATSTNTQYPGAKLVYDELAKKQAALGYTAENTANKVTTLSANSTDTQYPSAKAVYTELGKKQDKLTTTNIKGAGSVSVAIADGVITVSGTDNDTKYTLPDATKTSKGGVIVGDNINVSSGKISVPAATSTTLGVVKPGTNIAIDADGTISAKDTVYTLPNATTSVKGGVIVGDNINVASGKISVPAATSTTLGVVKPGTNITIDDNGVISAKDTTYTAGTNVTITNGVISAKDTVYTLPDATKTGKGGVIVGDNINVASGKISVNTTATPAANSGVPFTAGGAFTELGKKQDKLTTTNIKGAGSVSVAIADGVITVSGTDNDTKYTLPDATKTSKGGVIVGDNINVASGKISVPAATSTTLGVVKPGTNITIDDNGVISAKDTVYTLPAATSDTLGGVKTGTNITNSSGTISVNTTATPAANSGVPFTAGGAFTELGKKQDKLTTTNIKGAGSVSVAIEDGVITVSGTDNDTKYTLPAATSDTLGGVKTGTNITNSSGTISVATANGTTLGVVKQGTNTTISNGAVNVATANGTTLGVVKQGTNTTISSGAVNVATANGTTLGVVKQGTNTTISNGAVNVANATATVAGVSKLGVIPVAVDGSKTGTAEIWVE